MKKGIRNRNRSRNRNRIRAYTPPMANDLSFELDGFRAWVDGASIQIKALTPGGDPLDLGTHEVKAILAALTRMVEHIDGPPP